MFAIQIKWLSINEMLKEGWNGIGLALAELGNFEEALEYYDRALVMDDKYQDAWYNKGVALDILGRYKEAQSCYNKGVAINKTIRGKRLKG